MGYLKNVLSVETAKTDKFAGLTPAEKKQVDDLYFKDDWKALKSLAASSTKSPAFRAYAKDKLEDLNMISWDKQNQQRS